MRNGPRRTAKQRFAGSRGKKPSGLSIWPVASPACAFPEAASREHAVLLVMHHIISDGWSMGVFFRELAALYQAFSTGRARPGSRRSTATTQRNVTGSVTMYWDGSSPTGSTAAPVLPGSYRPPPGTMQTVHGATEGAIPKDVPGQLGVACQREMHYT